jgi:hypothetical protein
MNKNISTSPRSRLNLSRVVIGLPLLQFLKKRFDNVCFIVTRAPEIRGTTFRGQGNGNWQRVHIYELFVRRTKQDR